MRPTITRQNWRKHTGIKSRRISAAYYQDYSNKRKKRLTRIIFLILIILLLQSVFQAAWLSLSKIVVLDNKDVSTEAVQNLAKEKLEQRRYLFFRNNNFFLANTDSLAESLKQTYNLNGLSIKKSFPNKLIIRLEEKVSQFIWFKDGTYYLIDAQGALNRQIEAPDDKYVILDDQRSYRPGEGQDIFREDEIKAIQDIFMYWQQEINNNSHLSRLIITDNWSDLRLQSNLGFYVKLDTQADIKEQLLNLKRAIVAGNLQGTDIDYIDVRFADKIYYK